MPKSLEYRRLGGFSPWPDRRGKEQDGLNEAVTEEYFADGTVSEQSAAGLIVAWRAFLYYFGSALKL
ncbi:hypothetical protein [Gemmiger sp. An120]|uniref:hypothetical protein n=1 Tax=Gemmiger sp. An120 TaxID=1965549 RepID=UPI000B3A50B1|nr:hypothetical protein [Gemmiger sp. An120]